MKKSFFCLLLNVLVIFLATELKAQGNSKQIKIGDAAPALAIQQWIKYGPIETFTPGKIYVVEFTYSLCPPCRKAIPHLTELAKKYSRDIKFISFYTEPNDKDKPQDLSYIRNVEALMHSLGDKMDFPVAVEVPQQTSRDAWGVNGWPTAFLVDGSGRIAWRGNPIDLDTILSQVKAGNFNADVALKLQEDYTNCLVGLQKMKQNGDCKKAVQCVDSLLNVHPEKKAGLYFLKFEMLAGSDDKKAYQVAQWILDNRVEGFDWGHFLSALLQVTPANRDHQMELKVYDRTIEESESKFHAAYIMAMKADLYASYNDFNNAIATLKQAIEYNNLAEEGKKEYTEDWANKLNVYRFQLKEQTDCVKANKWLKQLFQMKKIVPEYYFVDAILKSKCPDYDFALGLVDTAVNMKLSWCEDYPSMVMNWKVEIYTAKKDYENAIACCQQALNHWQERKYQPLISKYERKLAELKEKSEAGKKAF